MPLFNIAKKNVKKNMSNYFLYMLSMIFAVFIYFIFKSIEYNKQVADIMGSMTKLSTGFKASALIIMMFSTVFIWYSNNFFIKKRKKEIGLYSLLGIEKKSIGRLLFYETLLIGLVSIVIGIFIGAILSKIFIVLLLKVTGFTVPIKFGIEVRAITNTFITFIIIFLLVSIQGRRIIYKYDLIDLFKAESKGEKEPKVSIIKTIISVGLIVFGYINYFSSIKSANFEFTIFLTTVTVILGTYMLFDSFILYMIKRSKKNRRKYFSGLNMISTSQLLYRIKGNSKTLATIAILSATTLTAMGVSVSYYKNFKGDFSKSYPFSYATRLDDTKLLSKMENVIENSREGNLKNKLQFNFIEAKLNDEYESEILVISESKYKERAKALNEKEIITLGFNNEAILFTRFGEDGKKKSKIVKGVRFGARDEKFNVKSINKGSFANTIIVGDVLVVKDGVYNKYLSSNNTSKVTAFNLVNNKNLDNLDKNLKTLIKIFDGGKYSKEPSVLTLSSYHENYKQNLIMVGTILFIGVFIGLVFLACTGSIIFFKQLSEAEEEVGRYKILRNIGVNKEEIKFSVKKQIGFVFLVPLIIGSMHSLCAIYLIAHMLEQNIASIMVINLIPYTTIYAIYYVLTYKGYYKTVVGKS
ncbi:ABC transporter permease [Hathewaya histolytica]|uniref:Peptide ABC transporter permease n=1 Tax=Hathewaya histolytica TaxID=1498 RepID=A0A4V6KBG9_HATHI|nr:ABC transporter permease [Hathewaya histolytica]VTQ82247.1 peptide ABC transporter permease [Hathewaya histolytica]